MILKYPFTTSIHFDEKVDTSKKTEEEIADEKTKKAIDDLAEGKETKEEKKEEETEAEEGDEGDLEEEDLIKAKDLYKVLQDPNAAPHVIRAMATAAGIKLGDVETKQDVKVATKSISELIKEEMGDEYKFLGDKLGKVIEKVLTTYVTAETDKVKNEIATDRAEKQRESLGIILDEVFSNYTNIDDKFQKKVYELVKEIPPKAGSDPKQYFTRMVNLASNELGITLTKDGQDKEVRRERNRNDAQNRLRSKDMADEKTSTVKSKDMSLAEAINKGIEDAEAAITRK